MATEFPDDTSLRIQRTLQASAARVWEAFTTPEQMARWMWASYKGDTTAEADVRVGGRYEVYTDAQSDDTGWPSDRWGFAGYYVEVVPTKRLVYTIHWDGPVGYNQTGDLVLDEAVIVDLAENDGTTEVVMWHVGIPADGISAPTHAKGIEQMFDYLETVVAA